MAFNFDIIKVLPYEIAEMIFQHLNGTDLIKFSEVNSEYNFLFGTTEKLMEKISFNIQKKAQLKDVREIINNSNRNYQRFKISQNSQHIMPMLEIINNTQFTSLTSICITKTDFETFDDFKTLMSQIEKKIQEIHLEQVYIKILKKKLSDTSFSFPKLKNLNATCCQASIFHEVFNDCKNLNKFIIKSGDQISTFAHRAILKILKQNVNLKILGIHYNVFNLIFLEDIMIEFKLQEFHGNDLHRVVGNQATIERNFHNFIFQQLSSLEVLSISNWLGIDVLKIIFHVPNLKELTLKGFHNCNTTTDWNDIELHANSSVKMLNFSDMSKNFQIFKAIIGAVKNIKELSVYSLNETENNFVNENCSKIVKINSQK